MFKKALQCWVDTWHADRRLFWIEFFGTVLGMLAAIILNFLAANPPMAIVLILYVISAALLTYSSHLRKSPFMFVLMLFYAVTSSMGLFKLII